MTDLPNAQRVRELLNAYDFVPLTSVDFGRGTKTELWTRGSRLVRLSWPSDEDVPEHATDYTLSGAHIVELAPADDDRDAIYALSLE